MLREFDDNVGIFFRIWLEETGLRFLSEMSGGVTLYARFSQDPSLSIPHCTPSSFWDDEEIAQDARRNNYLPKCTRSFLSYRVPRHLYADSL